MDPNLYLFPLGSGGQGGSGGSGGSGGGSYHTDGQGQWTSDNSGQYHHQAGPNGPGSPGYVHQVGPEGGVGGRMTVK